MVEHTRILVPVDGREGSARALQLASELAVATGASIAAVYVSYFDDDTDDRQASWLPESLSTNPVRAERQKAQAQLQACVAKTVPIAFYHRIGVPVDEILHLAAELPADFIVVGCRGMSFVEGFLLGSVSQGIVERSATSVIVAK